MNNDHTQTPTAPPRGFLARNAFWILAVVAIIVIQWPMFKGLYYKSLPADKAQAVSAVAWRTDYSQAQRESAESGKPLLLNFTASWCPPCQVMKHEVWTDESVAQAIEKTAIPVFLDVDLPANQELARRYQIQQIPNIVLTSPDGNPLKQANFMSTDEVKQFVEGG